MKCSIVEVDHPKLICLFGVSKDEELREAIYWVNAQPLLKQVHSRLGTEKNILD